MDELGLVVINEPASHTRIGQGSCRDTSPDLSIWSDAGATAWSNSFEDLGSDHRVLCVTVGIHGTPATGTGDNHNHRRSNRTCETNWRRHHHHRYYCYDNSGSCARGNINDKAG
ncbi:hypothetical protein HPB52_022928 [Rhipicephalus sanguineus]|uniref:Endonuclease/exonuclease/phosphatase domain-containing protein n=1 Tax=Rhipicephalus sanguineus TaxID=34632 RepID=A0A9D4QCB6_RHISA|nr:hypothetical protein HPB52_022928 [Rhipicephalus sanguineus]